MTLEAANPIATYTVTGAGPYAVNWPYDAGTLRVRITHADGSVTNLSAAEYTVLPTAGDTGSITLGGSTATIHDGRLLTITRRTPEEQGWLGQMGGREKGLEAQLDRIVRRQQEMTAVQAALDPGAVAASLDARYWATVSQGAAGFVMDSIADLRADLTLGYDEGAARQIPVGQLLGVKLDNIVLKCVASASPAWDETNGNGVKFVETGARFSSRVRLQAAIARGDTADLGDGVTVHVGDATYIRRAASTTIPGMPGFDRPATVHKSIITGDWQPKLSEPAQITAFQGVLDDMQQYHGDADDLLHVGDIVDRASDGPTGNVDLVYNFEDVLTEVYTRLSIPRTYFITGNHDSDGLSSTSHEHFRSHRQFRDFMGRRFYAVRMGNLLRIFLGTMSSAPGGETNRLILSWFDQVVKRNKGCNIEVYMHQPLFGYASFDEDGKSVQYKATSDLLVETISAADNIAFVASGHVARPEGSPNYYDAYGTRLIGFNMHIPRVTAGDVNPDDPTGTAGAVLPYGVLEYQRGSTGGTVRFWDASAHAWIAGRDVAVTYKYPLDLGGGVPDYDGRYAAGSVQAMFEGAVTIQRDLSEDRENIGTVEAPDWRAVAGLRSMLRLDLTENANDNSDVGHGPAIDFWVPGATFDPDATGETQLNITNTTIGGRLGVERAVAGDTDYTGNLIVQLGNGAGTTGALRDVLRIFGATGRALLPLWSADKTALPDLGTILTASLTNTMADKGLISSGANLNTYTEPGVYRILSGTEAAGISNVPTIISGAILIVFDTASLPAARPVAASGQMQIYIARAVTDGPRMYLRVCNGGTWVAWRLLEHDGLSRTSIAATPEFRGQRAYVGSDIYMAKGTASTADWIKISP